MSRKALAFARGFTKHGSASGLLLMLAALLALAVNNSPFGWLYDALLSTPVSIRVSALLIDKPLLLWINDGLMVVFFFLIGLEIKREIAEGELSGGKTMVLPVVAALGGVLFPMAIYMHFNMGDPETFHGWGIPMATDIAFSLGVLALLGDRVPPALKLLLLSVAIIDDIAAILVIALFYTDDLSLIALGASAAGLLGALILNWRGVSRIAPYILFGLFMWVCLLKSGVHATLAGVALAFAIPLRSGKPGEAPLHHIERKLKPWVAWFILPLFAFANAGVPLAGMSLQSLASPVSLGIMGGLFVGKQAGIFSFIVLFTSLGLCRLPRGVSWLHIYGLSVLGGIGFTMSLFIGTLAFDTAARAAEVRVAVLAASMLSALLGYGALRIAALRRPEKLEPRAFVG